MPNSRESNPSQKSALSTVSPIVWGMLVVILILVVVVGFLLGERNSDTDDAAQGPEQAQSATAPADSEKDYAADADKATPGTKFSDGTGDPMTFGPGGDTKTGDITTVHRKKEDDPFAVGAVDAPVVISEFSDFECPFCSKYTNDTEPMVLKKYVDKGLVRIEWNDLPVNGPAAVEGAKAGRAAAAQGKFAEFKHELYAASKDINGHPEFGIEDYMTFAKKAGVPDLKKFRQQATDDTYTEVIQEATRYGSQIGVSGTPGFVVGDQFVAGAQPPEVFEEVIKEQLGKAANA